MTFTTRTYNDYTDADVYVEETGESIYEEMEPQTAYKLANALNTLNPPNMQQARTLSAVWFLAMGL